MERQLESPFGSVGGLYALTNSPFRLGRQRISQEVTFPRLKSAMETRSPFFFVLGLLCCVWKDGSRRGKRKPGQNLGPSCRFLPEPA